jgi:hypothetical protein
MDTIIRTPVQRRAPLHFLVGGLQVWVTYIDGKEGTPFGVKFKWMEGQYSCSPLEHITEDGGYSYQQVESFIMLDDCGMDKRMTALETEPLLGAPR